MAKDKIWKVRQSDFEKLKILVDILGGQKEAAVSECTRLRAEVERLNTEVNLLRRGNEGLSQMLDDANKAGRQLQADVEPTRLHAEWNVYHDRLQSIVNVATGPFTNDKEMWEKMLTCAINGLEYGKIHPGDNVTMKGGG